MVNTVGKAIQEALTRMGRTQAWLAEETQVSDNAVSKWVKSGRISAENIPKVARLLGLYPDELLPGDALEYWANERRAEQNVEPGPDIQGKVPLITWVQAGAWTEIMGSFTARDAEEWLPCPVKHSDKTFVLRVRGESMSTPYGRPSFHEGDLIFVDPERNPIHGSLVVVRQDGSEDATFKKLVIEGERRYLKALNPAWPEPMMTINGNATICGVVIFKGEKF